MQTHFLGLRTVIYPAPDLAAAKNWYTRALGIEPYFDQPYYVGFNVGGYELGLDPNATQGQGGPQAYWGVADMESALAHLKALGAETSTPAQDVGEGIKVAGLRDPFGNAFHIIENPHFKLPG